MQTLRRSLQTTTNVLVLTAQLYRELAASALTLIPRRRDTAWY